MEDMEKEYKTEEDLEYLLENNPEFERLYFSVLDKTAEALDLTIKSRTGMIMDEFLKDIPIVDDTVSIIDLQIKLMEYQKEEYPKVETLVNIMSKALYGYTVTEVMENYTRVIKSITEINESMKNLKNNEDDNNDV